MIHVLAYTLTMVFYYVQVRSHCHGVGKPQAVAFSTRFRWIGFASESPRSSLSPFHKQTGDAACQGFSPQSAQKSERQNKFHRISHKSCDLTATEPASPHHVAKSLAREERDQHRLGRPRIICRKAKN